MYTPPEVLSAAGALPVRLLGRADIAAEAAGERLTRADACCFCKMALGHRADGDPLYSSVDFVAAAATCDQMRRAVEIWEHEFGVPVFLISMPKTDGDNAREYYREELRSLYAAVCEKTGTPPGDAALYKQAAEYNRLRGELKEARSRVGHMKFRKLLATAHTLPVTEAIESAEKTAGSARTVGIPVVLAGSCVAPEDSLVAAIEDAGFSIAYDYTCTGDRWLDIEIEEETADPVAAIADAYFDRDYCPFRRPNEKMFESIAEKVEKFGAVGVVVRTVNFCDMWAFEVTQLKRRLGVPVVEIDSSFSGLDSERVLSRLEAFAEVVGGAR